ncbi:MAG: hypothetical protein LBK99_25920 [Opitutaceae bacterium]|jgi:hypothetical protein|nr:hypothetical protein [Opitutaceae bacterium]
MQQERIMIGAHGYFSPAGTAFTLPAPGGIAGRDAKPGHDDPAAWLYTGIADWNLSSTSTTTEFKAPAPGMRVLHDKLTTTTGLKLKGKLMEMSNVVWQMLMSAPTLPASPAPGGQYNPLKGDAVVRGWLKLQQYNQRNELVHTLDVFVAMNIPGDVTFGENYVDVDVEADALWSNLNTGTLL